MEGGGAIPCHIIVKLLEKNPRSSQRKKVILFPRNNNTTECCLLHRNVQTEDIEVCFKMLKNGNCQSTILYLVKIPFKTQDEINTFPANKIITSTPELKGNIEGTSSTEVKDPRSQEMKR